ADRRIDVTARDRNLAAKEVTEGTGFRRQVDGRLGPVAAQHPRPWMPEARATRRQRNDERQRDGEASPGHRSCGTTMADALRQFKRKAGYRFRREWTLVAHHAPRRGLRAHRREIHLGSGPDARVERSVTRARRMSRPAKAGATDKGTPAPPTPLWRYLSSTPKAGGFTAAAASADRSDARRARTPHAALAEMKMGWGCSLCRGLHGLERHLVAERLELARKPARVVFARGTPEEVVGAKILVRLAALEHVVHRDDDRMADGDGGFRGAAAAAQAGVLGGEVRALGTARRLGGLPHVAAEPLGAFARRAPGALAGGLVVARTHAGPRGESAGGSEAGHVDADLGHHPLGDPAINAGDRSQQVHLRGKRADGHLDLGGQRGERFIEEVELGEDRADEQRVVGTEAAEERLPQLRQLLAQRALGEVRQYGGIPGPGDERPEHRAARDPEDVGRDRGQLDARVLEHLVEALRLARALLDLRRAVAREIAQLANRLGRDERWPHHPVLDELAEPGGIRHVGLPPRQLARVAGVHQLARKRFLEDIVHR